MPCYLSVLALALGVKPWPVPLQFKKTPKLVAHKFVKRIGHHVTTKPEGKNRGLIRVFTRLFGN